MKLIYAIVNSDDTKSVATALSKAGFAATKIASTGGFLSSGNTTFLMCTEDDKVNAIISVIAAKSRRRKKFIPAVTTYGVGNFPTEPIEVTVGGATIFVTNVERFEKV